MDTSDLTTAIDEAIDNGLGWLSDNAGGVFDALRLVLDGLYGAVAWVLLAPPFYVTALVVGALGWRAVGPRFGVAAAVGLAFCAVMGLWPETMQTLALVIAASVLALLVAVPLGIVAGFEPAAERRAAAGARHDPDAAPLHLPPAGHRADGVRPGDRARRDRRGRDPPALRLTAHGIRLTPHNFLELGRACGSSSAQMFVKIRLPFAMPSIMAGVNQCLMMAFGMVVIAGIVGSGGLGATIYDAVRTLNIAKSIDAAIAIVILTMILDRLTEGAVKDQREAG